MNKKENSQLAFVMDEVIGIKRKIEALDLILWLNLVLTSVLMLAALQLAFMDGPADWAFIALCTPCLIAQAFIAYSVWKLNHK